MNTGMLPEERNVMTGVYNKKNPQSTMGRNFQIQYLFLKKNWEKQTVAGEYSNYKWERWNYFWTWH